MVVYHSQQQIAMNETSHPQKVTIRSLDREQCCRCPMLVNSTDKAAICDAVSSKQQTCRLDTVCHRRQVGGLDAARKLASTFCYTGLYGINLQRPLGRGGVWYRYPFLQTANLCCRDKCTREWIVEQFATITGGVRIPGRSQPSLHLLGIPAVW